MTRAELLTPVDLEQKILDLKQRTDSAIDNLEKVHGDYLSADRDYDQAKAFAFLRADGNIEVRKAQTELDTADERKNRDVAEVAYRYAQRRLRAMEDELSGLQTISASLRVAYQTAGRGFGG